MPCAWLRCRSARLGEERNLQCGKCLLSNLQLLVMLTHLFEMTHIPADKTTAHETWEVDKAIVCKEGIELKSYRGQVSWRWVGRFRVKLVLFKADAIYTGDSISRSTRQTLRYNIGVRPKSTRQTETRGDSEFPQQTPQAIMADIAAYPLYTRGLQRLYTRWIINNLLCSLDYAK